MGEAIKSAALCKLHSYAGVSGCTEGRGSEPPSAHSLYNSCKASVKLQVLHTSCKAPAKAAALKKATDLSQLLCRR